MNYRIISIVTIIVIIFLPFTYRHFLGAKQVMKNNYKKITAHDSIIYVIHHPAFNRFGNFIFPWDDRVYDSSITMEQISSLMPYHNNVNVDVAVRSLNCLIDDINEGYTVFYSFYEEQQKKDDPTKKNTGLFFYRGKPGASFAVICPGGGFVYMGSLHEGFPYALEISKKGYNAFVLKYRTGSEQKATEDLALALSWIYKNAQELSVSKSNYSLWGSSAGARMVANIGSSGVSYYGGDNIPKPVAIVMAYTGHSNYSKSDPSTFAIAGENDRIAPPYVMERRINALKQIGINVEFHKYKGLGHGFGLGIGTPAEGWIYNAIQFWERHMKK